MWETLPVFLGFEDRGRGQPIKEFRWLLEAGNTPQITTSKEMVTLVLQPQELNSANNSGQGNRSFPRASRKRAALSGWVSGWASYLQNCEVIDLYCLSLSVCSICQGNNGKLIHHQNYFDFSFLCLFIVWLPIRMWALGETLSIWPTTLSLLQ